MTRQVKLQMTEEHVKSVLDRLYQKRYEDKDEGTIVLKIPTEEGIEELEKQFPELAKEFDDD